MIRPTGKFPHRTLDSAFGSYVARVVSRRNGTDLQAAIATIDFYSGAQVVLEILDSYSTDPGVVAGLFAEVAAYHATMAQLAGDEKT